MKSSPEATVVFKQFFFPFCFGTKMGASRSSSNFHQQIIQHHHLEYLSLPLTFLGAKKKRKNQVHWTKTHVALLLELGSWCSL